MNSRRIIAALALAVSAQAMADPTAEVVLGTLERADIAYREALVREHGWAVTAPLMDEARAALEAGDLAAAQQIADRALLTAEKSLEQARDEREAWTGRVVQR